MNFILKLWKKYSYIILIAFLAAGIFDSRIAMIAVVCMAGPILISLYKGRFWCGNICPRGSFYDNVVSKLSLGRPAPNFFKWMPFRYIVVIFMFTMFGRGIMQNWGNPAGIGMVFYRIIAITTLIGIILSLFFNERTWCNFCPMGTLSNLVSQLSESRRVLKVDRNCVSCKRCVRVCPMGVSPCGYKNGKLDSPDCIQCGRCAAVCPRRSIHY